MSLLFPIWVCPVWPSQTGHHGHSVAQVDGRFISTFASTTIIAMGRQCVKLSSSSTKFFPKVIASTPASISMAKASLGAMSSLTVCTRGPSWWVSGRQSDGRCGELPSTSTASWSERLLTAIRRDPRECIQSFLPLIFIFFYFIFLVFKMILTITCLIFFKDIYYMADSIGWCLQLTLL